MVFCAAGPVTVISNGEQGVHGVRAHASLHTSAHVLADQARHQLFLQQVIHAVVDMGTAVNLFSGNMGSGHTYILISGVIGNVIALFHYIGPAFDPVSQVPFSAFFSVGAVNTSAV